MPFVARLFSWLLAPVRFWKKLRESRFRESSMGKGNKKQPEGATAAGGKPGSVPAPVATHSDGAIETVDGGVGLSVPARPSQDTQLQPDDNPSAKAQSTRTSTPDSKTPEVDIGADGESISSEPDPIITAQTGPVATADGSTTPQQEPSESDQDIYQPQDSPPTLTALLLRYQLAPHIVPYLDFGTTISLQTVFPPLFTLCQRHILHDILPESHIFLYTQVTGEVRENIRAPPLYPVIKRIRTQDRIFPKGDLIVYEPEKYINTCDGFRPGEFAPAKIVFHLPCSPRPYCWQLTVDSAVNRDNRHTREKPIQSNDSKVIRKLYYKFDDMSSKRPDDGQQEQFPVKVYYKKIDPNVVSHRLHAVSIPFACLVDRLTAEMQKKSNGPTNYTRTRRGDHDPFNS